MEIEKNPQRIKNFIRKVLYAFNTFDKNVKKNVIEELCSKMQMNKEDIKKILKPLHL